MKRLIFFVFILSASAAIAQLPNNLSPADKVYGLSKFWQEVNYNFIYLDRVDKKMWDSTYTAMIITVQQTTNDYDYYRQLQRFCALLKDGHTNVYMPAFKGVEVLNTMFGDYRFFIENIGGKAIIVRTNLSKKDEIPAGSEVVEVNGKTTQAYINENVAPYISSSTDYVLQDNSISTLLQGLVGSRFQIKIKKPNQSVVTLNLTHAQTTEKEVFPAFDKDKELLDFKWYPNQIAYVGLNSFEDPKIDTLFINLLPELYKAKGLIIDLRYNGGGDGGIGLEILEYLTTDKYLYGSKSTSRLHIPSFKAWGGYVSPKDTIGNERKAKSLLSFQDKYYYHFEYTADTNNITAPKIVVPTAVLIGHHTASASEDFLIYADKQKHMTKIGENTFGSTGQPYLFKLPGGGEARICTKKDTYADGREFVGYGIKPDIEIKKTLADYLQKKDPVLDKSIEFITKQIMGNKSSTHN